jgi:hypothetical protein
MPALGAAILSTDVRFLRRKLLQFKGQFQDIQSHCHFADVGRKKFPISLTMNLHNADT